jgi:hypothetical protein
VPAPQQFILTARPARIWVTRTDNTQVLVEAPRLLGDTLVGFVGGRYQEILLPETRWVGIRQPAPRRTAVLVGAVVALGAVLISVLASNGPASPIPTPEDPPTTTFP